MQFETKIAIVVRDDLETWQKLNVTAFLTSRIVGADQDLIGENYEDSDGNPYLPLSVQPMIILATDSNGLRKIYERAQTRNVDLAIYVEEMFETGFDQANRAAVRQVPAADLNFVGLAMRSNRKVVDKITKGARLHP